MTLDLDTNFTTDITPLRGLYELQPLLDILVGFENTFIAGGCARYILSPAKEPAPYTDIDIYAPRDEADALHNAIINGYTNTRSGSPADNTHIIRPRNPLAANNDYDERWSRLPMIQIIPLDADGDIEDRMMYLLTRFDMYHCRAALHLDRSTYNWIGFADFLFDHFERNKKIDVAALADPVGTLYRIVKYAQRGYTIENDVFQTILRYWLLLDNDMRRQLLIADERLPNGPGHHHQTWDPYTETYSEWLELIRTQTMSFSEIDRESKI